MSRAILTSFYPSSFFIPLWKRYYAPFFNHIRMLELTPGDFNYQRITDAMNNELPGLLANHDLVMIADIDEIIVPDPEKWRNLGEYLDRVQGQVISCVGYNVIQMPWEPVFDLDIHITAQRSYWQRETIYDKPVITRQAVKFAAGNHTCNAPTVQDPDLVMFHLRDADIRRSFERRMALDNQRSRDDFLQRMKAAEKIPDKWRIL